MKFNTPPHISSFMEVYMADELKLLRSDDNDPLFDKTNMLKKEFPSDFRQIRYFTLLIVQAAPM